MPQFNELAGNSGTVSRGNAYQGPDIGERLMQMAETFTKVQQAKQANAQTRLGLMMSAAEKGFPIDPAAITKTAKQAGMPFMKPDDMKGLVDAKKQGATPSTDKGSTPEAKGAAGGGVAAAADAQKQLQNMSPKEAREYTANHWVQGALARAQAKFKSEADLQKYTSDVLALKERVLGGDQEAAGKLMAAGEVPFNLNQVQWAGATPEQRTAMINIAAGHESDADKAKRAGDMAHNMLQEGLTSDPQVASQVSNILAAGGTLPPELQSKLRPKTFKDLESEAQLTMDGIQAGVPDPASFAKKAQQVGFANALPSGIKPIAVQQLAIAKDELKLRGAQVGLEGQRVGLEKSRLDFDKTKSVMEFQVEQMRMAPVLAKLQMEEAKEHNAEIRTAFTSMLEAKKAGTPFPKELSDKVTGDFAKEYGLTVEEGQGLLHYLSFGSIDSPTQKLVPAADKSLASQAAGGGQGGDKSSGVTDAIKATSDSIKKGGKKVKDYLQEGLKKPEGGQ